MAEVEKRECCECPCGICDECGSHQLFGCHGYRVPRGWVDWTCDNWECEADNTAWNEKVIHG